VQAVYHSFPKATGCINSASIQRLKAAAAHGIRATMLDYRSGIIADLLIAALTGPAAADRCINWAAAVFL
jgi:hypothetical protein